MNQPCNFAVKLFMGSTVLKAGVPTQLEATYTVTASNIHHEFAAQYMATACNAHAPMVQALQVALRACQDGVGYERAQDAIRRHYLEQGNEGHHWFDRSTLRFFKSRLPRRAYTPVPDKVSLFITSEQGPGLPRMYSVRRYDWDKRAISTVGDFNDHATSQAARAALVTEYRKLSSPALKGA